MAYLKILPVASNTHLNNLIKYITRRDKTDEQVLVSADRKSVGRERVC